MIVLFGTTNTGLPPIVARQVFPFAGMLVVFVERATATAGAFDDDSLEILCRPNSLMAGDVFSWSVGIVIFFECFLAPASTPNSWVVRANWPHVGTLPKMLADVDSVRLFQDKIGRRVV